MIDVYVSFENAAQIRHFRKKLIRDFRCLDVHCSSCKDADICDIIARFINDLEAEALKHKGE